MVNGLNIYYTSKNIGRGLAVSKTASGLKPISKKTASGLKPISKGCKNIGRGLKILQ